MRNFRFWRWGRDREDDLDREIDIHLELETEGQVEAGVAPDEARWAARRAVGNVMRIKEELRDMQAGATLDRLWQDVRYAARLLRKVPTYTLSAVLVLALGIGATTAVFSLVDAALLRPLPFRDAHRLVMVWQRSDQSPRQLVSMLDFLDWKEQNTTFSSMAATVTPIEVPLGDEGGGPPETVTLQSVTSTFFEVLGVVPIAGRTFNTQDDIEAGQSGVGVVISERLWRTAFGADPGLVGGTIRLSSPPAPRTVVGVVPASFRIVGSVDIWEHLPVNRADVQRGQGIFRVLGRLKPSITIDQAHGDMSMIARNIERIAPATNKGRTVNVENLQAAIVGDDLRTTTLVLGGVVLFVLLLACANVANLILVRGVGRRREIAVRSALGGSQGRIARQLLTESTMLGLLGGIVGIAMAASILRVAPLLTPAQMLPEAIVLQLDWRLGMFAFTATTLTCLLFGLAPAWQAARVPLTEAMNTGGRGASDRGGRLRQALVVVEIAVALLLVTGAGLLVRTLMSLNEVDAGYRTENVVTLSVRLPFRSLVTAKPGQLARYWQAIEDEVGAIPAVRVVALASNLPLGGISAAQAMPFEVAGAEPVGDLANRPRAQYHVVTPGYFTALGVSVVRGRAFTPQDSPEAAPVAMVNQEFVRQHLAGRDPIGARITIQNALTFRSPPVSREIVGVVRQLKTRPDEASEGALQVFVPLAQNNWLSPTVVVRGDQDPARMLPQIRAAIARVDPSQAVSRVRTMEAVAAEATARPRFRAQIVTAFAVLATALAAVGIFSVLMFMAQQRAREFSLRLAIGASPSDLVRLVFNSGLKLVAMGLVLGLAVSAGLARFLGAFLFGVPALDVVTFLAAPSILMLVALFACIAPAFHALRADAVAALRSD